MKIIIDLSKQDYLAMRNSDKRTVGSIWLTDDVHGSFKSHKPRVRKKIPYRRLTHGRVSYGDKGVRLSLFVGHDEQGVNPVSVITDDSWDAREFIREMKEKTALDAEIKDIIDNQ